MVKQPSSKPEGHVDIVVVGDEVESILTAVSAARCGAKVMLCRRSTSLLGGLCTRGGLNYMDITPEFKSPLFKEFLDKTGVKRVALEATKGDEVLATLLQESGVEQISGVEPTVRFDAADSLWTVQFDPHRSCTARVLIDATPDADVARQLQLAYTQGLGHIFDDEHNFLGITPVFRMSGVDRQALINFERQLRERLDIYQLLQTALPHHPQSLRQELVDRPIYSPDDMDYIDILNPVIGIIFHHWRHGEVTSYPEAEVYIDGFNTARLSDQSLGFNGLVMRMNRFEDLVGYSQGRTDWPPTLNEHLKAFEAFMRTEGGFADVELHLPEELYVRQTLNMHARQTMTAALAIRGGVDEADAIGTFSYWLDLRGVTFTRFFPDHQPLPKPVFNVGLNVCFPKDESVHQFAFVGRSAGYSPIGQGACRIVQHNAMLGEALGIAAALSVQTGEPIDGIEARAIRTIIGQRQGTPVALTGHSTWDEPSIAGSPLIQADLQASCV